MQGSVIENSYIYKVPASVKFKNVFNNIIKFLSNALFIFLIAMILILLVYNVYTKKNGTVGQAPFISAYVIVSPSMVPTINVEDAVVAYHPNSEVLKKGDIITFISTDARYTGLTVTHRILEVNKENNIISYKTKGDNNTTPDDAVVRSENIYGKVILVIPWLGYLQFFLTKSYGWLLLVVLPCIGIIIYDIKKLLKTVKKSKVTKNIKFKDVEILDSDEEKIDNINNIEQNNNINAEENISSVQEELLSNDEELLSNTNDMNISSNAVDDDTNDIELL